MLRLMNLTMGTSVCQLMVVRGLPFRVADLKLPLFSREPESSTKQARISKQGFTQVNEKQHF